MKKILTLGIVLIALITFSSLATNGEARMLAEGKDAPALSIANSVATVNLKSFEGKYVLIDFWSSADGESRVKSNDYASTDWSACKDLTHISVNFDRSEQLFDAIVTRDNLNKETQFHVSGAAAERIKSDFGLNDGYKSFLVGPAGKIVAVNPDKQYIKALLGA